MMKYFFFVLVFCAVFQNEVLAKKNHRKNHHPKKSSGNKIVGGQEVDIKDYPHQAFILTRTSGDSAYECGGAIISEHYILTAGHCVTYPGTSSITATIGATRKFDGPELSGTYAAHEKYLRKTLDYDIAYFKTDEAMNLDGVNAKAVPLINSGEMIPSGTVMKVSGWGDTSEGGDDSDTLKAVDEIVISNDECNQKETHNYNLHEDRQFCAGVEEGGAGHCQGDSGGPGVVADSGILIGIVSAGFGCARPDTPGIYTNVTNPEIRSWILEKTGV